MLRFFPIVALFFIFSCGTTKDSAVAQTEIPCTEKDSIYVVNFTIGGYDIVETKCDSVKFIEDLVKSEKGKWKVVGINYDHSSEAARDLAMYRSQIVKDILMMAGVNEWDITPSAQHFDRPKDGEALEWPHLKAGTAYEVGVYVQKNN